MTADTELAFVLTSGGPNAGIVSEPGHPHRSFQIATRPAGAPYGSPDAWAVRTPRQDGSWWPVWEGWLAAHSSGRVQAGHLAPVVEAFLTAKSRTSLKGTDPPAALPSQWSRGLVQRLQLVAGPGWVSPLGNCGRRRIAGNSGPGTGLARGQPGLAVDGERPVRTDQDRVEVELG